jgi:hypothetical protein
MLSPIYNDSGVPVSSLLEVRQIRVVKPDAAAIVLRRRAELLRNVDYMETQIGRLAKMARDMRAEILLLTTE